MMLIHAGAERTAEGLEHVWTLKGAVSRDDVLAEANRITPGSCEGLPLQTILVQDLGGCFLIRAAYGQRVNATPEAPPLVAFASAAEISFRTSPVLDLVPMPPKRTTAAAKKNRRDEIGNLIPADFGTAESASAIHSAEARTLERNASPAVAPRPAAPSTSAPSVSSVTCTRWREGSNAFIINTLNANEAEAAALRHIPRRDAGGRALVSIKLRRQGPSIVAEPSYAAGLDHPLTPRIELVGLRRPTR